MDFAFTIKRQFKGILFFFLAIVGAYVFYKPIMNVLGIVNTSRWYPVFQFIVYLVLVGIILLIPLAVALQTNKESEQP